MNDEHKPSFDFNKIAVKTDKSKDPEIQIHDCGTFTGRKNAGLVKALAKHMYPNCTFGFCSNSNSAGHITIYANEETIFDSDKHGDKFIDEIHVVANKIKRRVEPHIYKTSKEQKNQGTETASSNQNMETAPSSQAIEDSFDFSIIKLKTDKSKAPMVQIHD